MTMLNDSANVKKVVKLLATRHRRRLRVDWFISPHKDFDASKYPNELTRDMVKVATAATTTVFEASDQMPAAVGSGSFWKQVTAWIAGQTSETPWSTIDSELAHSTQASDPARGARLLARAPRHPARPTCWNRTKADPSW